MQNVIYGSAEIHALSIIRSPIKDKRKHRKCNCGCENKAGFLVMANDVCLASGCQLQAHRIRKQLKKSGD